MKGQVETPMLTSAEAEVMNVVWDFSPTSVADIVNRLPRELAYTTVMTTVRILENKGFVEQCGKRGRAFLYQAAVQRDAARGSMSLEIANRLFGGSLKSLMLSLVQTQTISIDDLEEVKRLIAAR
ncbi:MAG: BlaI/MecI/CopY family transcriptional regulator [Planctomycetaceae bacterium]|nr:BlaI/MecI/CopY family transcriptional regulator [Planctomycetaceae bacterium]